MTQDPEGQEHKTPDDRLDDLRRAIDSTDRELVDVLARRLALVDRVAGAKSTGSESIRDRGREDELLARAEARAREAGVSAVLVRKVLEDVIAHSLLRQAAHVSGLERGGEAVRVAFQGAPWAYSHIAAQAYLAGRGLEGEYIGHRTFALAAAALRAGDADLAVLPIENTTAGSINEVYNLLRTDELHIIGEAVVRVDHCLAAPAEVPLSSLRRVLSHPQALEQCAGLLATLPQAEPVTWFDTAEAMAAVAASGDRTMAAIGSRAAAEAHGLTILRRGIANQEQNWTRFIVLARDPVRFDPRVPCKTSLILVTRHERGALLRCLSVMSNNGLQLTKLESRPRPGRPWEYMFFIDVEGNVADEAVAAALDLLKSEALYLKLLGSYPVKAEPVAARAPGLARSAAVELDRQPKTADEAPTASMSARPAPPASPASSVYRLVSRASRAEDTIVRVGNVLVGGTGFTLIAGPCAVETREQIEEAAHAVREHGAHVLRGGVFKPRTSPYSFQGLGFAGLELLVAAGRAVGLPVVTEVLSPEQVRPVAQSADLLQVGARNMQNFELLRELGRIDRPVLLKRGPSSTIDEWLAAAEYILAQGNGQVILCERGIRTFESATRSTLDLSAVPVLRERTHLPVIVDPSHGTGRRTLVAPMAWAARAAGAHGLIVEVHPDPAHALSDGDQSLTPAGFGELVRGLARVPGPEAES
jgi:chorismate mutase/prephenate dehydratase